MHTAGSAADKTGFFLVTAAGVLAPIPNGSNAASAAALIGIALSICLLCAPFAPEPGARSRALLVTALLMSGLLVLWTLVQTFMPIFGGPDLSALAGAAASDSLGGREPNLQPFQSLGYVLMPLAAFMAALLFVRNDEDYLSFLHILLGLSFVVTLLCIVEYIFSPGTRLLEPKQHYLGSFTGTFVNPNTAATYFGIMLLLSLSLSARQLRQVRRHQRMIRAAASNPRLRKFLVYFVWTIVFAVALMLTRSRAGILSAFAGVCVFICSYAYVTMAKREASGQFRYLAAIVSVAAVVMLFAVLSQRVALRIQTEGILDTGRLCTYESTWRAIQDHFWLGTGLGTFQDVFPAYRTPECGLNGYWEMAHSVYLEGWLSLGVLFIVILAVTYYQLLKTYAHGYRHRRRFRFVPLVSLSILVLLSLHSLFDFSLQIPGVAVVAALALGTAAAVSLAPRADNDQDGPPP